MCHTHLVVPGSLVGSVGHTGKVPTAEFPCKARVFGSLAEIPRQDLLHKLFAIQHHKAFAVWQPRDRIGIVLVVEDVLELKHKDTHRKRDQVSKRDQRKSKDCTKPNPILMGKKYLPLQEKFWA